ncbi:MAG: universal stress protein [Alphaproteobacteria bacterium]|nr:universal stress protein [Alphaproteobacteria bacterium]
MTEPTVLVPLDGSEPALAALPVANALGEVEHAALLFLHVAEDRPPDAESLSRVLLGGTELDGLTVATRTGKPAAELVHAAAEIRPQLIVLCKHGAIEPPNVLGGTAMNVLHNAPCPVVLVPPSRGSTPWRLQHILVPHDGTPGTSTALRPAQKIAEHAGADLLVVHVAGTAPAAVEPGYFTTPRYVDQPHHEWPAWSSEFGKRFVCLGPPGRLQMRVCLARGNAAAEVMRLANQHATDLIVLAWRGVWDAPRAAVLRHIVAAGRCPIAVVRV